MYTDVEPKLNNTMPLTQVWLHSGLS